MHGVKTTFMEGGQHFIRLGKKGYQQGKNVKLEIVSHPLLSDLPRGALRSQAIAGVMDQIATKLEGVAKFIRSGSKFAYRQAIEQPLLPQQIGEMVHKKAIVNNAPLTLDYIERLDTIMKQRPPNSAEYISETADAIRKMPYNPTNDPILDNARRQISEEIANSFERLGHNNIDNLLWGNKPLLEVSDDMWQDVGKSLKKLENMERTSNWLESQLDNVLNRGDDLVYKTPPSSIDLTVPIMPDKLPAPGTKVEPLASTLDDALTSSAYLDTNNPSRPFFKFDDAELADFSSSIKRQSELKAQIKKNLQEWDDSNLPPASAPAKPDNLPKAVPPGAPVDVNGIDAKGIRHFDPLAPKVSPGDTPRVLTADLLEEAGESVASAIVVKKGKRSGFVVGVAVTVVVVIPGFAAATYFIIRDGFINRDIVANAEEGLARATDTFETEEGEEEEEEESQDYEDETTTSTTTTSTTTKRPYVASKKEDSKTKLLFSLYVPNYKEVIKEYATLHYLCNPNNLSIIPVSFNVDTLDTLPVINIKEDILYTLPFFKNEQTFLINNTTPYAFVLSHYQAKIKRYDGNVKKVSIIMAKRFYKTNNNVIKVPPTFLATTTAPTIATTTVKMFRPDEGRPISDASLATEYVHMNDFDARFNDIAEHVTNALSQDVSTYLYGQDDKTERVFIVSHGKVILQHNDTTIVQLQNNNSAQTIEILVRQSGTFVFSRFAFGSNMLRITNIAKNVLDVQVYLVRIVDSGDKDFLVTKLQYLHETHENDN